MIEVLVDEDLKALGVRLYCLQVEPVTVRNSSERLDEKIREIVAKIRGEIGDPSRLTNHPIVRAYRRFLWKLGIDPTKMRPSSEALARRALRRGDIPRINNVVDAGNAASLATLVPIGLYDLDRLVGPLRLTRESRGLVFLPIGSGETVLDDGVPVLVDGEGRVIHVYPHRDSQITMIRPETRRVLAVAGGVEGVPEDLLAEALDMFVELLREDGVEAGVRWRCKA